MIKGVIFDLDGTLIDSMNVWGNADKIFVEKYGMEYKPDMSEKLKTMTIEEASRFFIQTLNLNKNINEVAYEIAEIVSYQYKYKIPLKKNANEITEFLNKINIPLCIATATYKNLAEAVLKRHKIYERFKFVLTGEDVKSGKTSPEIYLKCSDMMGISPSETLVVEDSLHCIETASKSGFVTIGIYDEFNSRDWNSIKKLVPLTITDLEEIKNLFTN